MLGFLFWQFVGAWRLSQPGVKALRGPLEKGLLSVPGPLGEDVAGISWESLRILAGQTEVGRGWRRPQTQGQGVAGSQPAGSGLQSHTGSGRMRMAGTGRSCSAPGRDPALSVVLPKAQDARGKHLEGSSEQKWRLGLVGGGIFPKQPRGEERPQWC